MSEYLGTIIVAAIIVLMVFFIVRGMVKDRKKGKHICGGDCSNCHGGCSHKLSLNNSCSNIYGVRCKL